MKYIINIISIIILILFPVLVYAGGDSITRDQNEFVGLTIDNSNAGINASTGICLVDDNDNEMCLVMQGSNNSSIPDFGIEIDATDDAMILHATDIGLDGDVSVTGDIAITGDLELGGNLECVDCVKDYDIDWGVNAGQVSGVDIPVIISTVDLDHFIQDVQMNCVMDPITVTDEGGLNIQWNAGEVWVDDTIINTDARNTNYTLNNNAGSFIYAINSTSTLQISNSHPVGEHTLVQIVYTYLGDIKYTISEPECHNQVEDTHDALDTILSEIVVSGLEVAIDLDGTNVNDFTANSGIYFLHAHHEHVVTSTLYSAGVGHGDNNLHRYYHSSSAWTSEDSNGVDFGFWDNGTDKIAVSNAKWYSGYVFVEGVNELVYVYPQTQHNSESSALSESITYPPYHQGFVVPLAQFVFRGSESAFGMKAYFLDIRPTIVGTGGTRMANQFVFTTIVGDSGSTTADDIDDVLTIAGGTNIETEITDDTVTVNLSDDVTLDGNLTAVAITQNNRLDPFTSLGVTRGLNIGAYHQPPSSKTNVSEGVGGFNIIGGSDFGVGATVTALNFGNAALAVGFQGLGNGGSSDLTSCGINVFGGLGAGATYTTGDIEGLRVQSAQGGVSINGDACSLNILSSSSSVAGTERNLIVEKPTQGATNYQVALEGNGAGSGIWFDESERVYSDGSNIVIVPNTIISGTLTVNGSQVGATDHVFDEYDDLKLLVNWRNGEGLPFEVGDILNRDRLLRDAIIQLEAKRDWAWINELLQWLFLFFLLFLYKRRKNT